MPSQSILLAYYGDDFSGSTDAMESLALAGVRTILFLQAPDADTLKRYPGVRVVGMAGVSRSMTRDRMDTELTSAFKALRQLEAPLLHYKVCSTFDSSPQIGSIGRAIELGMDAFGTELVPVVVGAPVLGRYCAFGNLFARSGLDSPVYRLDRHPTMSRHPTTPMDESDLRVVLARQTDVPIELIDLATIDAGTAAVDAELRRIAKGIVLFDTTSDRQLTTLGQAIWKSSSPSSQTRPTRFVVGSSGVEYALRAYWQQTHEVPIRFGDHRAGSVAQVICASGSCSPVTARQIAYARAHGFVDLAVDPLQLMNRAQRNKAIDQLLTQVTGHLAAGDSVIVHTSCGPDDVRIKQVTSQLSTAGASINTAEILGTALGEILRQVIHASGIIRAVVTGGDTSGYVARQLGIEALEFIAPIAPGSPLCRVHARPDDQVAAGLEIAFKGGQVGHSDYLVRVRDGSPPDALHTA